MGGSQQIEAKPRQDEGDRFLGEAQGGAAATAAGIERVSSLRVLGVILNDKLTAADHVIALLSSGSSIVYAMRVLRLHGTPTTSLQDMFRATVISRMLYAAPSWSGMCSAVDHVGLRLD